MYKYKYTVFLFINGNCSNMMFGELQWSLINVPMRFTLLLFAVQYIVMKSLFEQVHSLLIVLIEFKTMRLLLLLFCWNLNVVVVSSLSHLQLHSSTEMPHPRSIFHKRAQTDAQPCGENSMLLPPHCHGLVPLPMSI
eukprot:m.121264 g.121264  ORF g.121264 m.121264 type:complete len:137 (-) comp12920_c6_seq11:1054-1464(-)